MAQHTIRNTNKKVTMNENELEKMTILEEDESQTPASAVTEQVVAKTRPNLTWQMSTPVSLSRHRALKFEKKKSEKVQKSALLGSRNIVCLKYWIPLHLL